MKAIRILVAVSAILFAGLEAASWAQDYPPIVRPEAVRNHFYRDAGGMPSVQATLFEGGATETQDYDLPPIVRPEDIVSPSQAPALPPDMPTESLRDSAPPQSQAETFMPAVTLSQLLSPVMNQWLLGYFATEQNHVEDMSPAPPATEVAQGEAEAQAATASSYPVANTAATVPTALSPSEVKAFEGSAFPESRPYFHATTSAMAAPLPRQVEQFSFFSGGPAPSVANAVAEFESDLTLQLATPESVAINQVFQQLVHVQNSGDTMQHDIRVTQVCDHEERGAAEPQIVVIDCIAPGETKTIRFSACATELGSFAVRYIAENAEAQAGVDDIVVVDESGFSVDFVAPTRMYAGDEGEIRIAIQNSNADEAGALRLRYSISPVDMVDVATGDESVVDRDGAQELDIPVISPGATETAALRFSPTRSGVLRIKMVVESADEVIASQALQISVISRSR